MKKTAKGKQVKGTAKDTKRLTADMLVQVQGGAGISFPATDGGAKDAS